jgi:carboxypeptidase C (cathepsin A)
LRYRFPVYKPKDNTFSIWTESYGGHYGPSFADYFERQNKKILDGSIDSSALPLKLDTVGIVNGCIDILTQIDQYPHFAYNNTYGIQAINETEFQSALNAFPKCRELVDTCKAVAAKDDPNTVGNNAAVNTACAGAFEYCFNNMWAGFANSGVSIPRLNFL